LWSIRRNARFYDLLALTSCDFADSPSRFGLYCRSNRIGEVTSLLRVRPRGWKRPVVVWDVALYVTVGSMRWVHKLVNWKFGVRRRVLSGDGGYFRLRALPFVRCIECSWSCARSGHKSTGRLHNRSSSTIDSSMFTLTCRAGKLMRLRRLLAPEGSPSAQPKTQGSFSLRIWTRAFDLFQNRG
jgi:hypothetical protein